MNKTVMIDKILASEINAPQAAGTAYASANIALCKYWGKRNLALNLPVTGSLSVSLGELGTTTRISIAGEDALVLDGVHLPGEDKIAKRLFGFLDYFRTAENYRFSVESESTVPIGAGLASSASGFAATVLALKDLFQWEINNEALSVLARMGSGSASRSIYKGFVEWDAGVAEDGMDSVARSLDVAWPEFRIAVLSVSEAPKKIGSTEAMNRTVDESTLYESWPKKVAHDLPIIRQAVYDRDLSLLGAHAESNALSMHATMWGCVPPISYFEPESIVALQKIWKLRKEGVEVYATMDAGPNVKLIFETKAQAAILSIFPALSIINPNI